MVEVSEKVVRQEANSQHIDARKHSKKLELAYILHVMEQKTQVKLYRAKIATQGQGSLRIQVEILHKADA